MSANIMWEEENTQTLQNFMLCAFLMG